MTPLGFPVVPELYGSAARCVAGSKLTVGASAPEASRSSALGWPSTVSPGPSSTTTSDGDSPACEAPSTAWASSGLTVISILACASVSCLAMSLAVNNALMVVAVAPARRMPWNATANAELLGECNPTTSPTPIPRSARAPAKASTRIARSR